MVVRRPAAAASAAVYVRDWKKGYSPFEIGREKTNYLSLFRVMAETNSPKNRLLTTTTATFIVRDPMIHGLYFRFRNRGYFLLYLEMRQETTQFVRTRKSCTGWRDKLVQFFGAVQTSGPSTEIWYIPPPSHIPIIYV